MKEKLENLGIFLFKTLLLTGLTSALILLVRNKVNGSLENMFLVVGLVYFFVGGSTFLGDFNRRTDFNYLQTRSLSHTTERDEIKETSGYGKAYSPFLLLLLASGACLLGVSYWL